MKRKLLTITTCLFVLGAGGVVPTAFAGDSSTAEKFKKSSSGTGHFNGGFYGETVRNSIMNFTLSVEIISGDSLGVIVDSDAQAVCSPFKRINKSQFSGSCIFKKIGMHSLKMESNGNVVGTAVIQVKTNITAVTWGSSTGKNSEPVKFDDPITFTVAGQNLLQDKQLAFAVKDCGESNVEVGTPSNTLRTFQCTFYKAGGAKAGYMPGVVKDEPNGQVLFDGWSVPVEVAAKK